MIKKPKKELPEFVSLVPEEDLILLDALVKSPAFGALKRLVEAYKKRCMADLVSATDASRLFQTQGRIIGINVLETLPELVVRQRDEHYKKVKAASEAGEKEKFPGANPIKI